MKDNVIVTKSFVFAYNRKLQHKITFDKLICDIDSIGIKINNYVNSIGKIYP